MNASTHEDVLDASVPHERREHQEPAGILNLAQALDLWVELTDSAPKASGLFAARPMSPKELHREIQDALDLDPTEVTGRMLLSFIAQSYFEQRSYTVDALLNEPQKVATYLQKASRLAAFLRGKDVAGLASDFASRVKEALVRYGAATESVLEIVDHCGSHGDRGSLAVLRRDAMRTLAKLSVHQFLDGSTEQPDVAPVYGKFLYRWDNINSMLRAMLGAPSGVTVNMIQSSSHPYGVHFVFAIRNGGRLFVFTDKEQQPHPLAEDMCRRPDKILAERSNRHWFPYDLAGLKFDDEGRAFLDTSNGRSLVQYQSKLQPIKPLAQLAAPRSSGSR